MNSGKFYPVLTAVLIVASSILVVAQVSADETAVDKVQDAGGDLKTAAKKSHRDVKRQVRKAKGQDNVVKDAKDKMNDAGDDIGNDADKMKRKTH